MRARMCVYGLVVLGLCMATAGSLAKDQQTPVCEAVEARFGPSIYLPPCAFQGGWYDLCIDTWTDGDLEGTWHAYGTLDNFVAAPSNYPGHPGIISGWSLSAFETGKGVIWTQDAWGTHADLPAVAGQWVFSQISYVVGGTGEYEGATGWLGLSGTEVVGGYIEGRICAIDRD